FADPRLFYPTPEGAPPPDYRITVMGWTAPRTASVCQDRRRCHAGRARSGEERVPGSRGRHERRGRLGAQASARPARGLFSGLSPCLVAMEARASAHHWGRQLLALGFGRRLSRGAPPVARASRESRAFVLSHVRRTALRPDDSLMSAG